LRGLWAAAALTACSTVGDVAPRPAAAPAPVMAPAPAAAAAVPASADPATPVDPPRVLTNPGSGVSLLWSGAAIGAGVAGRSVVVLESDLRHLSAVDWSSGEARWRIEEPFSAGVQLAALDDRVMLYDGERAVVIEAARGRVLGRHAAPHAGQGPRAHGVAHRNGACAWAGTCGIQAFDCRDGQPLGAYYGPVSDDPSEYDTTPCMPTPRLLGAHQGTIAMVVDLPRPGDGSGSVASLVGVGVERGERRWDRPLPAVNGGQVELTDDGGVWVLDVDAHRVEVFDAGSGARRWGREIGPGQLRVHAVGDALVVGREHGGRWRLSAYATDDGASGWSVRLARRQLPVLPDGPVPDAQAAGIRRVYALLDPTQRGVVGELVAGRDERLWRDPGGGFVLIGRDLREIDAEGRLTRQRPFTGTRAHTVTEGHVLTDDGSTIEIYDRELLRERARLEGRLSIVASAGLPSNRVLLRRDGDDDGVVVLLGLEAPSRGAGRR